MNDLSAIMMKSSLFMDELHPNVSELVLNLIFSPIGNVAAIYLMKEENVKQFFSYAFVRFTTVEEAAAKLDTMDYDKIYGKSIRILWDYKYSSLSKEMVSNIIIKDLDTFTAAKNLHDAVWNFNKLSKFKIGNDKNKMMEYSGLAPFEIGTNAAKIIKLITELRIDVKEIFVSKFQALMPFFRVLNEPINNIFKAKILQKENNLASISVTKKSIKSFNEFMEINNEISISTQNDKLKDFKNGNLKKTFISDINNNVTLNGKKAAVCTYAKEEKVENIEKFEKLYTNDPNNKTNIYVKNLCSDIESSELQKMFEIYGEITSINLIKKRKKGTRVGLINYVKHEDAERAIKEMNGKKMGKKLLFVDFAKIKEEKQNPSIVIPETKQNPIYDSQTNIDHNQHNIPLIITSRSPLEIFNPSAQHLNLPPILAKNKPYLVGNTPNCFIPQQEQFLNFTSGPQIIPFISGNHLTNTMNYQSIPDNYTTPKYEPYIDLDHDMCNNMNAERFGNIVYKKVEQINTKWTHTITKAILRNELPILKQLLSDDVQFRNEVFLYSEILDN